MAIERTFSIIKPDAVHKDLIGKIIAHLEKEGLRPVAMKMKHLSRADAEGFYAEHKGKPFFDGLIDFMTSGPVVVMALEGEDAITRYRAIMGVTDPALAAEGTLRKLYAESKQRNAVHGSDSPASASREIGYFFSKLQQCDR